MQHRSTAKTSETLIPLFNVPQATYTQVCVEDARSQTKYITPNERGGCVMYHCETRSPLLTSDLSAVASLQANQGSQLLAAEQHAVWKIRATSWNRATQT